MDPFRIHLDTTLETRNKDVSKDAMLTNCFVDATATDKKVVGRPGLDLKVSGLGAGNGIFFYNDKVWSITGPGPIAPPVDYPHDMVEWDLIPTILQNEGKTICYVSAYYVAPSPAPLVGVHTTRNVIISFDGTTITPHDLPDATVRFRPVLSKGTKHYFQNQDTNSFAVQNKVYSTEDFNTYTALNSVTNPGVLTPMITAGGTSSTAPDNIEYTSDFLSWGSNFSSLVGDFPVGNGTTATNGVAKYDGNGNWSATGLSSVQVYHFKGKYYAWKSDGSAYYSSPDSAINFTAITGNLATFNYPQYVSASATRAVSFRIVDTANPAIKTIKSLYTDDGITWTDGGFFPGHSYTNGDIVRFALSNANGVFLMITSNKTTHESMRYYTSPDGINWTEIAQSTIGFTITPVTTP